ncbi:GNAT family N-acetyltransferase [Solwaraspora sp. WMMD1047]|uniref:GNAT family N-acetyltransferase n=1 Tax=Solwaraspora sp. WMMD1047 TaxID=3016102 RepID=UPI002416E353|nr:GNAT family N-acetyltransferase [Solwaraspora sp. WMMD1047]MDG4833661.1 GNAT family N-acetyltransferase [Solwaraspora sp. WMMD1047]
MSPPRTVHDRAELAGLLGRDPALHAYQLGDLDDFFWPYTSWFRDGDSVALVYHGGGSPILLAFEPPERRDRLIGLLTGLAPLLPRRLYAHLSPGAEAALTGQFAAESHGPHRKLALTEPARLPLVEPAGEPLTTADLPELERLYRLSYPDNSFDPRMLATGHYLGLRRAGELVAVAGVHVWSARYRVSALGNVTTHPELRGQGIGTALVAGVCRRLLRTVDHITLNVRADNTPALALYARLGFTPVAEYTELTLTATA